VAPMLNIRAKFHENWTCIFQEITSKATNERTDGGMLGSANCIVTDDQSQYITCTSGVQ